jgi:hypothetical protein
MTLKRISCTMDLESWNTLKELPVNQTRDFKLDDREFTIVDKEEFIRICELANLRTEQIV